MIVSPEARQEFGDARRYYEQILPGLGDAMFKELRACLRRILRWPLAFPAERGDIRRAILIRFPYKLLYAIQSDHIYLIAVAHQHRKPDYWIGRSDPP